MQSLQQLITALKNPNHNTQQKQQQVMNILEANPNLMEAIFEAEKTVVTATRWGLWGSTRPSKGVDLFRGPREPTRTPSASANTDATAPTTTIDAASTAAAATTTATFSENSNYWQESLLEIIRQNIAG